MRQVEKTFQPIHLPRVPGLSIRERQIEDLILIAKQNREIAASLGIRTGTVRFHVSNLLRKRGVANRWELLALLLRQAWRSV